RPLRRQRRLPLLPRGRVDVVPPHRYGPLPGGRRPRPRTGRRLLRPPRLEAALRGPAPGWRVVAPRMAANRGDGRRAPGRAPAPGGGRPGPPRVSLPPGNRRLPGGVAVALVPLPPRVAHVARL